MRRYLFLFASFTIIAMIVAGCAETPKDVEEEKEEKKEEEKEEVAREFSEDAYIEIYAQMIYLSEKYMSEDFGEDMDAYTEAAEKYQSELLKVYEDLNVNEAVFNEWGNYLEENPEKMYEILERSGERLEELREEL